MPDGITNILPKCKGFFKRRICFLSVSSGHAVKQICPPPWTPALSSRLVHRHSPPTPHPTNLTKEETGGPRQSLWEWRNSTSTLANCTGTSIESSTHVSLKNRSIILTLSPISKSSKINHYSSWGPNLSQKKSKQRKHTKMLILIIISERLDYRLVFSLFIFDFPKFSSICITHFYIKHTYAVFFSNKRFERVKATYLSAFGMRLTAQSPLRNRQHPGGRANNPNHV